MDLDDELCLCFHVSKRKVVNYIRVEKPRRLSQLSNCFGAGTGCGWCRPFLMRIYAQMQEVDPSCNPSMDSLPTAEEYASKRKNYIQVGKKNPSLQELESSAGNDLSDPEDLTNEDK